MTRELSRWLGLIVCGHALITGCGDPYARYADAVHEDVDGANAAAVRMTARISLTIAHNQIPDDSLTIVANVVRRAARDVRSRATHFSAVTPPADLAAAHANLSGELATVALALDAMAITFQKCVELYAAGDSTGLGCEARLNAVNSRFGYVGEDLSVARQGVARLLAPHGVLLGRR